MASSAKPGDVVVVHASDAAAWPRYLQDEVKAVTSGNDVKSILLKASMPQASLDVLLHGRVVVVVATPLLLDILKADDVTNPTNFQLAAGCVLLLCGTEYDELDPQLLTRCFPDGTSTPTVTHTQIADVISNVETLRKRARHSLFFDLVPDTVFCEHSTMVTVSFREVDTSSRSFSVTVADVDCGLTVFVNRLTCCFTAPAGQVGDVIMKLTEGDKVIGRQRMTYVSDTSREGLHQVALELLDAQSELMTEAGLKAARLDEAVDKILAVDRPALYQELFSRFVNGKSQYDEELPSLLHWCAKYGLTKVNSRLLRLPYAGLATCVANKQGHSPADLAKIKRNSDIYNIIKKKQEDDERYTEMYLTIRSMLTDDDLQSMDYYYNVGNNLYSTYGDMVVLSPGYVTMDRIARERLYEELYSDPDENSDTPVAIATGTQESPDDIFRLTPQEREEKLKNSMAPHLRELISIIEGVKGQERTIEEAEKLFKSWQNQYQPRYEPQAAAKHPPRSLTKTPAAQREEVDSSKPSLFGKFKVVLWGHNRAPLPPQASPSPARTAEPTFASAKSATSPAIVTSSPSSGGSSKASTNGPPPVPPRARLPSNNHGNPRSNPSASVRK